MVSLVIAFLVNDVSGASRIAQDTGDGKLLRAASDKFGWIERLFRVRLLFLLLFWGLVGTSTATAFRDLMNACFSHER